MIFFLHKRYDYYGYEDDINTVEISEFLSGDWHSKTLINRRIVRRGCSDRGLADQHRERKNEELRTRIVRRV